MNKHAGPPGPRMALKMSAASPMLALWSLIAAASGDAGEALLLLAWAAAPAVLIFLRLRLAMRERDNCALVIDRVDDAHYRQAVHVLLLTLLPPIAAIGRTGWSATILAAMCAAAAAAVVDSLGFGHGELLFAAAGRRVVTAWVLEDDNPFTCHDPFWLVAGREELAGQVAVWRLTDELFIPYRRLPACRPSSTGRAAAL